MRQNGKPTLAGALLTAWIVSALIAGCDSDDPAEPQPPTDDPLPTTADAVVEDFKLAWDRSDSTALDRALAGGFSLLLDPAYVARVGLPNDLMSGGETLRAAGWIFSGQSVFYDGNPLPGVTDVVFTALARQEDWAPVSDPEGFGALVKARHSAEMTVRRDGGFDLAIAGDMTLYATWRDSAGGDFYELARLEDGTDPSGKDEEAKAFGELLVEYLVNRAPEAVVTVNDTAQTVGAIFVLDAAGSYDHDGPLHTEPYRWRLDPDGWWSVWTGDPDTTVAYDQPGTKAISLEVRDRWGVTDQVHQTLTVTDFPVTADQLVANFVANYVGRDLDGYRAALHPDFQFVLAVPDGDETYYDYDTDTTVAATMFSGEQGAGEFAYPVAEIQMVAYPQSVWEDVQPGNPDFGSYGGIHRVYSVDITLLRPGYTMIQIQGPVDFYAVRRDSLHDGELHDYWEMLGQVDHTDNGKVTETMSWSAAKALYR